MPELIKRNFYDVQNFNQKVYEERKDFLNLRIKKINQQREEIEKQNQILEKDVEKINNIISENEVYSESIALLKKYREELEDLVNTKGNLSQIKNIIDKIEVEEQKLNFNYEQSKHEMNRMQNLINEYREFVLKITRLIYHKSISFGFDIILNKTSKTVRPIDFSFIIQGDAGEGIGEVKKNLFDLLICNYNKELEIMIHDSSCYSGIDPRQINGLLLQLEEIAISNNKQVFVSINKYQLGDEENENIKRIENQSVIILSENKKLLGFNF